MNEQEYLLTVLIEECSEISQAACKALRFGLDDGYPGTTRTNRKDLSREIGDFLAIKFMLDEKNIFDNKAINESYILKEKRVLEFMKYSRKVECLDP